MSSCEQPQLVAPLPIDPQLQMPIQLQDHPLNADTTPAAPNTNAVTDVVTVPETPTTNAVSDVVTVPETPTNAETLTNPLGVARWRIVDFFWSVWG